MNTQTEPRLHNLASVMVRTNLSRSVSYKDMINPRGLDGTITNNPNGRLKVVYVGRAVRVTEADLCRFIELLGA